MRGSRSARGTAARFDEADLEAVTDYFGCDEPLTSVFDRSGVVEAYERELAEYHGRAHALLLSSGTSALYAAYFALGVDAGSEIIAPAVTFCSTVTPAVRLGASVRLVDIDSDSYNIDPAKIDAEISSKTRAIVFTNMWGYPADVSAILDVAQRHGLPVIEDNSLALCASREGALTGTASDVCAFSLGSTKLFSGGQGGALLTDRRDVYERALILGHFGPRAQAECRGSETGWLAETGLGMNFRIHVLSAAISRSRFRRRDELIGQRKARYGLLGEALSACPIIDPPAEKPDLDRGIWQGYVAHLAVGDDLALRQRLYRWLDSEGLDVKRGFYYRPLHRTPLFAGKATYGHLRHADECYRDALSFPLFAREPIDEVERYCEQLVDVLAGTHA